MGESEDGVDRLRSDESGGAHHRDRSWSVEALDELLCKYLSVWLWSITLAATTGLSFAFSNSSLLRTDWGPLSLTLAVVTVMGLSVTLLAWMHLLQYLRYFLIPAFLLGKEVSNERRADAARNLARAFRYMVFGVVLSLGMVAVRLAFEAAQWGF